MFSLIFVLLYSIIMSATLVVIILNISMKKVSIKSISIYALINYLIYIAFYFNRTENLLLPSLTFCTCILLYINTKDLIYSTLISIVMDFIFAVSDVIVGAVTVFIFRIDYKSIISNETYYFIIGVFILITAYTLSKAVKILSTKININTYSLKEYLRDNFLIVIYVILGLCSIYAYTIINKKLGQNFNKVILSLYIVLIAGFFIFTTILTYISNKNIKNRLENQHKQQEYEQLKEYTNMLETVSNDLRKFKHDYLNILGTIGGYIETENITDLKSFYKDELLPESKVILDKNKNLNVLQHIKIISLKGLISSKIIAAQAKGIETNIQIVDDIESLTINLIDICRIIGILMDNAIEAAEMTESKKISLMIAKDKEDITFFISNSCPDDTPPVNKIYEQDFSTKGEGRGLGLKIVRNIIDEKYDNILLNTKIKENVFTQEIVIMNDKNGS
ncbi:ATPase/histidine kinase/DNA gyrase B/HSP90 domain protein [Clostridiales bacterium oral taxon 876 str. F0540]|nr:ATPase/histidine kinase/DNA gyrase B/HSP90 domain protein [Clostridiales bacterium oral taxon 876 str. F0540]